MNKINSTKTNPPIYYVHRENNNVANNEYLYSGLSAGFLSTRNLDDEKYKLWENVFDRYWKSACNHLSYGLRILGVEAYAIIPCTRLNVVEGMVTSLNENGIIEIPNLITKADPKVSFAGQKIEFICNNVLVNYQQEVLKKVNKIAICDDFSETGNTISGVYKALLSIPFLRDKQFFMVSVGISSYLE